jgi:ATP-dependent protease ClpP protease subunit
MRRARRASLLERTADHGGKRNRVMQPSASIRLPTHDPDICLLGSVNEQMLRSFLEQRGKLAKGDGPVVVELSSTGGEAETGRRLAQELRMLAASREVFFLGKSYVYSAGVTVMAAIPASHRFLTRDTVLLIHERRISKTLNLSGALRSAMAVVQDMVAELQIGMELERHGFEELVAGSKLRADDLIKKVMERDWYVKADEALSLKLVAGLTG